MLLPSEASFFFFHHLIKLLIPSISLISPHLSSSFHLPSTPKPKPSPSPSPALAPAVVVASHIPSRRRPTPSPAPATTLTSLLHRCRPTHALDPLRRSKPLTHLEVSAPTLFWLNFSGFVVNFVVENVVVPMLFWAKLKKHLY